MSADRWLDVLLRAATIDQPVLVVDGEYVQVMEHDEVVQQIATGDMSASEVWGAL